MTTEQAAKNVLALIGEVRAREEIIGQAAGSDEELADLELAQDLGEQVEAGRMKAVVAAQRDADKARRTLPPLRDRLRAACLAWRDARAAEHERELEAAKRESAAVDEEIAAHEAALNGRDGLYARRLALKARLGTLGGQTTRIARMTPEQIIATLTTTDGQEDGHE